MLQSGLLCSINTEQTSGSAISRTTQFFLFEPKGKYAPLMTGLRCLERMYRRSHVRQRLKYLYIKVFIERPCVVLSPCRGTPDSNNIDRKNMICFNLAYFCSMKSGKTSSILQSVRLCSHNKTYNVRKHV
jgi:hypothetical protein